jgi:hypothetical protein
MPVTTIDTKTVLRIRVLSRTPIVFLMFSLVSEKPVRPKRLSICQRKGAPTMNWLHLVSYIFGGIFLTNAVPHLVSGMMGRPFQSPFAKPPGQGLSSSTVNVLWGFFNAIIGYMLVLRVGRFDVRSTSNVLVLAVGALLISLQSARHFGKFHGGNTPED